jgi:pseudouridine-5'-phosphate glycosidase
VVETLTKARSGHLARDSPRVLSEEIAAAIAVRGPMVALETTVITHGLPSSAGLLFRLRLEEND